MQCENIETNRNISTSVYSVYSKAFDKVRHSDLFDILAGTLLMEKILECSETNTGNRKQPLESMVNAVNTNLFAGV